MNFVDRRRQHSSTHHILLVLVGGERIELYTVRQRWADTLVLSALQGLPLAQLPEDYQLTSYCVQDITGQVRS